VSRPTVFITRKVHDEALSLIAEECNIDLWEQDAPPPHKLLCNRANDVDGIMTNVMDRIDVEFLKVAANLKVISQIAVGLDNIDLVEATRRGIPVGYTPGVVSEVTADHTMGILLASAHRLAESDRWVRNGQWKIAFHPLFWLGSEVHHSTLGIIGMGRIGAEVAKRAKAFDMEILYNNPTRKPLVEAKFGTRYTSLDALLRQSDFVSIHCPLSNHTRNLIGAREFNLMKSTAILINTARGPIVNSRELYLALKSRAIAYAALDVTDPEPLAPEDPLLTLDNILITPHLGSATEPTRKKMTMIAAHNLLQGIRGDSLIHCANPEALKPSTRNGI